MKSGALGQGLGRGKSAPAAADQLANRLQATHVTDGAGDSDAAATLSFAGRSLKLDTRTDAAVVVDAITSHPTGVEVLDLSGNTLGVEAAEAVGDALKTRGSMLKRAIWFDLFTGRLRSEIPSAMRALCTSLMVANTRLVELDLSDNAFGPDGVRAVQALLESPVCHSLRTLRFNNNGLGTQGGQMLASSLRKLSDAARASPGPPLALKVFVCGRNRLENKGAVALAAAFKSMGTLEEVRMPQNGIYHDGVTALVQALAATAGGPRDDGNRPGLRTLNFSDMLFTNRLLEHLHLIKSEDESVRGRASGGSLLPLLRHAVSRPYFPKGSRQVLQCFLSLPSPKLDPFSDLRHQLLQALYQT